MTQPIYTRRGDAGETDLYPVGRVAKNHPRMEALGTLDELNSWLGVVRSQGVAAKQDLLIEQLQETLCRLGTELATPANSVCKNPINDEDVAQLERQIDGWSGMLPPLKTFVLPVGSEASAFCQLARTVCRRLERCVITLRQEMEISPQALAWINRFSDFLFTLGRVLE